jgi:hypothetical protein
MAETGGGPMTRQEFVAFAQKLEAWGQGLEPKEQAFLEEILARAVAAPSGEVEGFMTKTDSFMTKTPYFGNMPAGPDIVTTGAPETGDWGTLTAGRFSGALFARE